MHDRHANWIGGERRPALSEATFEVHADATHEVLGAWPRSSADDLRLAVRAAHDAEPGWASAGDAQRRRELRRSVVRLAEDPDPDRLVCRRLGLDAREVAVHVRPLERALEDRLEHPANERGSPVAREGPLLLAPDWAQMWVDPARTLFSALARGRTVILLSDGRVPMLADALAQACEGLPPGVVSVVHDDGLTCLRASLDEPGLASVVAACSIDEVDDPDGIRARSLRRARGLVEHGFGLGLELVRGPAVELQALQNRSAVLRAHHDVDAAARAAVERGLSRAHALSGVRPGQIARIVCPARRLSSFTEALIDAIEDDPGLDRPIALARAAFAPHVERALSLGHDEGATLLCAGSREAGVASPLVFTNVEERMRLAHFLRPAPILCLLRVADESEASRLADELDREESSLQRAAETRGP